MGVGNERTGEVCPKLNPQVAGGRPTARACAHAVQEPAHFEHVSHGGDSRHVPPADVLVEKWIQIRIDDNEHVRHIGDPAEYASKAQQKAARAQQKNKRKAERKAEDSAYARAAAGFFRAMQLHGKLCCQSGGNGWDGHGVSAAGG